MRWFFLAGTVLLLVSVACRWGNTAPDDLHSRLGTQLDTTQAAYQQALDLWERLADGETVICQEQLAVPSPFTLTQAEASQAPPSVTVRDHLNLAIQALEAIAALWQAECQQPRQAVPVAQLREMKTRLDEAAQALAQAEQTYATWQP